MLGERGRGTTEASSLTPGCAACSLLCIDVGTHHTRLHSSRWKLPGTGCPAHWPAGRPLSGLHLVPGHAAGPLVAHDDAGALESVDLPDVLVKGADGQVAVIVRDGIDQQEAVCPLHALGQGVTRLREAVLT